MDRTITDKEGVLSLVQNKLISKSRWKQPRLQKEDLVRSESRLVILQRYGISIHEIEYFYMDIEVKSIKNFVCTYAQLYSVSVGVEEKESMRT